MTYGAVFIIKINDLLLYTCTYSTSMYSMHTGTLASFAQLHLVRLTSKFFQNHNEGIKG